MISKTIGFRGTQHFQTYPYQRYHGMEEILHQLGSKVGLSHCNPMKLSQCFIVPNSYPAWCRISSIHRIMGNYDLVKQSSTLYELWFSNATYHIAFKPFTQTWEPLNRLGESHSIHRLNKNPVFQVGHQAGRSPVALRPTLLHVWLSM